jgi:hypothetical protein
MEGVHWLTAHEVPGEPNVVVIEFTDDTLIPQLTKPITYTDPDQVAADERLPELSRRILGTALRGHIQSFTLLDCRTVRATGQADWDSITVINTVMAACELEARADYEEVWVDSPASE